MDLMIPLEHSPEKQRHEKSNINKKQDSILTKKIKHSISYNKGMCLTGYQKMGLGLIASLSNDTRRVGIFYIGAKWDSAIRKKRDKKEDRYNRKRDKDFIRTV